MGNSIPAQGSIWSFAPQPSKVGDGTFTPGDYTWRKIRVGGLNGGGVQIQQVFPPEMGGPIIPTGAFKSGAYYMAELDIIPRAESIFGYLLRATMGNVSSVTGQRYTPSGLIAATAVNSHIFNFDPTSSYSLPWLAARKMIPGATSSDNFGEIGIDCKVANLRLNAPAAGLITARIGIQGRKFDMPNATDTNAWAYSNSTFEDSLSALHSGRGSAKINGVSYTISSLTFDVINGNTTPQQEMIISSYHPDDIVPMTRGCTARMVVKWSDPTLWRALMTGSTSGVSWSALPFLADTAGNTKALEVEFQSADNMAGASFPYALKIFANRVTLALDPNGIQLQPGNIIMLPINLTVLEPTSSQDYAQIVLQNQAVAYAWS